MPLSLLKNNNQQNSGDFFDRYGSDIKELQGNISDVTRYDNYNDAVDDLKKFKDDSDKMKQIGMIRKKLLAVDPNQVNSVKDIEMPGLNLDFFDMLPDNELPKELVDYSNYADFIEKQNDPNKKVASFDDYLATLGKKEVFMQTYPGAYKNQKQQVEMTPEEKQQAYHDLAGLTPEEREFYKMYNDKLGSEKELNRSLQEFQMNYAPGLRSMGSKGNEYEQELAKRVGSLALDEPQPTKYEIKLDEKTGNLIYINPLNPNDRKVVKYANTEKPPTTKGWEVFQDETGKPYLGERVFKDGKWTIEYRDELNKEELEDYTINKQKQTKTGIFAPKSTGSRRYRGSSNNKGEQFSKWNPDRFSELSVDDLNKYTAGELNSLLNYSQYLNEDVSSALTSLVTSGKMGDMPQGMDNTGEDVLGTEDDEMRNYLYKDAGAEEKAALDNVDKWMQGTIKAWGRADLTPDQWREEIGQEPWTDMEFAIVTDLFRQKTGEQY